MAFQNQPFNSMLFHFKWKSNTCHWMLIFKKSFLNSIQIFWNISDIETNWEYVYFFLQLSKKKGKMKDCCSFITKIFCCRIWFDLFQNFNQLVVFFFLCSIIEISFCIVCRIFPWDGIQRCRFVIISQKDGFSLNLFCCSVQQDYYLVNIFAYFFFVYPVRLLKKGVKFCLLFCLHFLKSLKQSVF